MTSGLQFFSGDFDEHLLASHGAGWLRSGLTPGNFAGTKTINGVIYNPYKWPRMGFDWGEITPFFLIGIVTS